MKCKILLTAVLLLLPVTYGLAEFSLEALNVNLKDYKEEYGIDENNPEVARHKLGNMNQSMEEAGWDEMKKQQNDPDSIVSTVTGITPPSADEVLSFEDFFNRYKPGKDILPDDTGGLTENPPDSFKGNMGENMAQLWVMAEVLRYAKPAKGLTELTGMMIFSGESKSCTNHYIGTTDVADPMRQKCKVKVKISYRYTCDKTGKNYESYSGCSTGCDGVCKKYFDYDGPALQLFDRFNITTMSGVTNGEKELATGRAYNVCRYINTKTSTKCVIRNPFGGCIKRVTTSKTENWCCYDNPVVKDLSYEIKRQLGMNLDSCNGIPMDKLSQVDFNHPSIMNIMKSHVADIVDDSMSADLAAKFISNDHNTDSAREFSEDMAQNIDGRVHGNKPEGIKDPGIKPVDLYKTVYDCHVKQQYIGVFGSRNACYVNCYIIDTHYDSDKKIRGICTPKQVLVN